MGFKRLVNLNELKQITCKHCGRRYTLRQIVETADRNGNNNLSCPHCSNPVGVVQS